MTSLSARAAQALALCLRERGLSQRKAARLIGWKQSTLSDKLTGRSRLSLDDVELIAERLGVPVAQLLDPPALLVDEPETPEASA